MNKYLVFKFWEILSPKRKWQVVLIFFLTILSSFAEMLSIGSVIPFLALISNPNLLFKNELIRITFKKLGLINSPDVVFFSVIFFISVIILSALVKILLLWANTKFSYSLGAEISVKAFRNILYQPYEIQIQKNSSELISNITYKVDIVSNVVLTFFSFLNSIIFLLIFIFVIIYFADNTILYLFICLLIIYLILLFSVKRQVKKYALILAHQNSHVLKVLQEAMGGIRDVILDNLQRLYCDLYTKNEYPLRKARANLALLGSLPKIGMETLGIIILILSALIYQNSGNNDINKILPFLGALALGSQKLLPILQLAYSSYLTIKSSQNIVNDVLCIMEYKSDDFNFTINDKITFDRDIVFNRIFYKYPNTNMHVLNNINFTITKGQRIGIIGETGSGKSTILDLIMGLLVPTSGSIEVDSVRIDKNNSIEWQKLVSHVPQFIFLTDSSIAENIAFGIPKESIDLNKVKSVARKAHLSSFIDGLELGYETFVGERGVRLSGGQRQRIGIARALYKESPIIIFDEATSSLDTVTESQIMESIDKLDKDLTIIIVAHRTSTLSNCDYIINLNQIND